MNLIEIQQRMFQAVVQPLTPGEHMQPWARDGKSMQEVAVAFIKPNDRLSSFERLEIYNRQYWFRVLGSLEEDFPGLRAVIGQRRFQALCKAYLSDCPSQSFTLRNLGSRLESWLGDHPEWIRPRAGLALDMVRLEWAEIQAFDGAEEPAPIPQEVLLTDPDPRFRLQPYLQLLRLRYPVDELLVAIRQNGSDNNMASNAVTESHRRTRAGKVARQKPQSTFLAVHRIEGSVYFKRLEPAAFTFLTALQQGKSLTDAAGSAFEKSCLPESELLSTIQNWFENWSTLGWLRPPAC